MEYLKPRQYYVDLYDRITVDHCRGIESFRREHAILPDEKKKISEGDAKTADNFLLYLELLFATGERYLEKERTIEEWINRDKEREEFFNSAKAPNGITCLSCGGDMFVSSKYLHDWNNKEDARVLFMYDCVDKYHKRRVFFNNGMEYMPKQDHCSDCGGEIDEEGSMCGDFIITKKTCIKCGKVSEDKMDVSVKKKEEDKNFERDRVRFCLSEEKGKEYIKMKASLETFSKTMEDIKKREKEEEKYKAIDSIKKLTLAQVSKVFESAIDGSYFSHPSFKTPEMENGIQVAFVVQDDKENRSEYDSRIALGNLVKKTFQDTNWRLMSEGIDYRLGVLSGRLRGYETKEELLKLLKKV